MKKEKKEKKNLPTNISNKIRKCIRISDVALKKCSCRQFIRHIRDVSHGSLHLPAVGFNFGGLAIACLFSQVKDVSLVLHANEKAPYKMEKEGLFSPLVL